MKTAAGNLNGVVVALVTSVHDPEDLGRVELKFPWLSDSQKSPLARVAAPLAGKKRGLYYMPEVDDEVLVAFEHGDFSHPYIIGYLWNGVDKPPETETENRVIVTPGGHTLRFEDKAGARRVVLKSSAGHSVTLDDAPPVHHHQVRERHAQPHAGRRGGTGGNPGRGSVHQHAGRVDLHPLKPGKEAPPSHAASLDHQSDHHLPARQPRQVTIPNPGSIACTVDGGAVLAENDAGVITPTNPFCWCVKYTLRSMGLNASTIGGRKVVLESDFNVTDMGLPLLIKETHKAFDLSTPVPLPPLGPIPGLPPELLDESKPVVTATIPVDTFKRPGTPATLVVNFTLAAAFPWKRSLIRLGEATFGDREDLTPGKPPGATVSPSGDSWTTPNLSVTLTLTAAYMNGLKDGGHNFFMTGVSRRGWPGFQAARLKVTT